MAKIAYIEKNFRADRSALIVACNQIISEYQAQGFVLTLRQLYYQLVSREYIENNVQSYKKVGSTVNDARLAGLIDWEAIEDRGRNLEHNSHWTSPDNIIGAAARGYAIDHWQGQLYRPEVWIEKDALTGVIADICGELDVAYFACRGYNSQSEQWRAAKRFEEYDRRGQIPVLLHLGDHDSSGIDMTRDNRERLEMFMGGVSVVRLALSIEQVAQYNLPPNPAKESDTRFAAYAAVYGDESWELDALQPTVIVELIRAAVTALRDDAIYLEVLEVESAHKLELLTLRDNWAAVSSILQDMRTGGMP